MRNLIFVLLTAISTLLCIGCALVQDKSVSVETIERIKYAIVPIVCGALTKEAEFKVAKTVGSAFFINEDGNFLTAGHVFDEWNKIDRSQGDCFPAIYMAIGGWRTDKTAPQIRIFRFQSCIRNQEADVAVCKPVENPFLDDVVKKQVNFLTFGTFLGRKDGTPVAFTGFPLDFLRPVTSKGNIASLIEADQRIVIDKAAWPGASGSPLYLSDGAVIGVLIQRGINDGSGLAYARTSELIEAFLSKNTVRFHQQK